MSFSPFVGASSGGGGGGTTGKSIQSITFYSSSGGATPGIAGAKDTYKINYTDGTSSTFVVQNGSVGTSITKVSINTSGHLIVTMSDGSTVDAGATGSQVTFTPILTSGTKIGSISVDGKSTDLYCSSYTGSTTDYGTIEVKDGEISLTSITDQKVRQTSSTADEEHELLLSESTDTDTKTEGAVKSSKITINPSNGRVRIQGNNTGFQVINSDGTMRYGLISASDGSQVGLYEAKTKSWILATDKKGNSTFYGTSTKATQDADGNVITTTYATKSELPTIDTEISDSSTNPVQNKTIKTYIDDIVGDINSILATLTDIGG